MIDVWLGKIDSAQTIPSWSSHDDNPMTIVSISYLVIAYKDATYLFGHKLLLVMNEKATKTHHLALILSHFSIFFKVQSILLSVLPFITDDFWDSNGLAQLT